MDFSQALKEKWYTQGFNACNIFISQGPRSAIIDCHKTLGYGYTKTLFVYNKDYLEYNYSVDDLVNIGNTFLKRQKQSPLYFDWLIKKSKGFEKKLEIFRKKVKKINLKKISDKKVLSLFHKLFNIECGQMGYSHVLEGIFYVVDPLIEQGLRKILSQKGLNDKFKDYFALLTQPTKPSLLNQENISILKICQEIKTNKKDLKILKNEAPRVIFKKINKKTLQKIKGHTDKYFWVQINYFVGEPLTEIDFIRKIKEIFKKEPNFNILTRKENQLYKRNLEKKQNIIKELNLKKELVDLFDISEKNMYWQDDRKKFLLTCVYLESIILKEIAKRFNIPFELAKQLIPEELEEKVLEKIDINNLRKRAQKGVYLFFKNEKKKGMAIKILLGKKARDFVKKFKNIKAEKINDLRGVCASAGRATGKVRICRTIRDLKRFQLGEVLVAPMTRPEYLPAMKKAVAIITDEGGITSHAAIISRELEIPCIIGTKVATKIFKNGMMVEVKANHGLVKIIKK